MTSRRRRGFTAVEFLVASLALTITLIAVSNLNIGVGRVAGSYERTNRISRNTRVAIDEVLYQLRGAESVQATMGSSAVGPNTALFRLPAYNPNTPGFFLDNVWDQVALTYDPQTKVIRETLTPGTGSARPTRSNQVIAREVTTASFEYVARQNFRALNPGVQTFTLGAPVAAASVTTTTTTSTGTGSTSTTSTGTSTVNGGGNTTTVVTVTGAQCYVNGTPSSFSYTTGSNTISVNCPARGADIQILYPVRPDLDAGASLPYVAHVRYSMTMRDPSTEKGNITLQGVALLRNRRD